MDRIKKMAFVCFPGFQSLDLVGPMEVFSLAAQAGKQCYQCHLLSEQGGLVTSSSGMAIITEKLLPLEGFDSLIIIGGQHAKNFSQLQHLTLYIQQQQSKVKRTISICTGVFLLARAGLLDNKKITTHWSCIQELQGLVPSAEVVEDAIYVKSGDVYTSAGVSSGMDLALSIVEEDHGKALSLAVARELVIFYHRPGGQKQFSDFLLAQSLSNDKIKLACSYIHENLTQDLSVPFLAEKVNMSPRNFSRQFTQQLKLPPGRYIQKSRVDKAKHLLEQGQLSINQVADSVGIKSVAVLARLFKKYLAISPNNYKQRFYKKPF